MHRSQPLIVVRRDVTFAIIEHMTISFAATPTARKWAEFDASTNNLRAFRPLCRRQRAYLCRVAHDARGGGIADSADSMPRSFVIDPDVAVRTYWIIHKRSNLSSVLRPDNSSTWQQASQILHGHRFTP